MGGGGGEGNMLKTSFLENSQRFFFLEQKYCPVYPDLLFRLRT